MFTIFRFVSVQAFYDGEFYRLAPFTWCVPLDRVYSKPNGHGRRRQTRPRIIRFAPRNALYRRANPFARDLRDSFFGCRQSLNETLNDVPLDVCIRNNGRYATIIVQGAFQWAGRANANGEQKRRRKWCYAGDGRDTRLVGTRGIVSDRT